MNERANQRVAYFNGEIMPEHDVRVHFVTAAFYTVTAALI
ncbi:MAG: hypothetical protein Ct9H300mP13_7990 [Gammaproteobacteria bacterium]|nr:MAG: hypothetical protein Ct9H300mP13_7990 [Gammaproteobacteria bacterium]